MLNEKQLNKAMSDKEIQFVDEAFVGKDHFVYWHVTGNNPVMLTIFNKKGNQKHQGLSNKYRNY